MGISLNNFPILSHKNGTKSKINSIKINKKSPNHDKQQGILI